MQTTWLTTMYLVYWAKVINQKNKLNYKVFQSLAIICHDFMVK